MSVIAAILLLISSFTHAGWNFLCKKARPPIAFFFCGQHNRHHLPIGHLPALLEQDRTYSSDRMNICGHIRFFFGNLYGSAFRFIPHR